MLSGDTESRSCDASKTVRRQRVVQMRSLHRPQAFELIVLPIENRKKLGVIAHAETATEITASGQE
jgi:hypothetical protein